MLEVGLISRHSSLYILSPCACSVLVISLLFWPSGIEQEMGGDMLLVLCRTLSVWCQDWNGGSLRCFACEYRCCCGGQCNGTFISYDENIYKCKEN